MNGLAGCYVSTIGKPHEYFDLTPKLLRELRPDFYPGYDVSPDGQRFLTIRTPPETAPRELNVILNWFQELERLAPTN